MIDTEVDPARQHKKQRLVQSKLTFTSKHVHTEATTSPFFGRAVNHPSHAPAETTMPTDSSVQPDGSQLAKQTTLSLYTERRSNLDRPPPVLQSSKRSVLLAQTAAETKALLPNILKTRPDAPPRGVAYDAGNLFRLDQKFCPGLPKTTIRVLNADTIDAAINLTVPNTSSSHSKPVLILNLANAYHSGGGWLHGALAQEEALCYRSSLSFTLKLRFYPISDAGGVYSPSVIVIRENMAQGHKLLDLSKPDELPVVSCVSVAAVRGPAIVRDAGGRERYTHVRDRQAMKEKMRVVLRVAAVRKHRVLVLGALGCGAFGNPRVEVVECWKEVLEEGEFAGGWWESIVFAVMEGGGEKDGDGNFGVFWRGLDGVMV